MKACHLKDAPSYFDYWANCDTDERCAKHYSAAYGGIMFTMNLNVRAKKLNDGNTYVLGHSYAIQYPRDYPL